MVRTRVGYAGGAKASPTYRSMGDHTEIIEVDFDPSLISYKELLEIFWSNHNPFGKPWSRQYMSMILYRDERQRKVAEKSRSAKERRRGSLVHTEIRPLKKFYLAEHYHQKYRLQNHRVLSRELRRMYPKARDFVDSTAAARINGFLGGYGDARTLDKAIGSYGLTEKGQAALRDSLSE